MCCPQVGCTKEESRKESISVLHGRRAAGTGTRTAWSQAAASALTPSHTTRATQPPSNDSSLPPYPHPPPRCCCLGRYIHTGLEISVREAQRLRAGAAGQLLSSRKLMLVLDLDHTLLNSTRFEDLSPEGRDPHSPCCCCCRCEWGGRSGSPAPAAPNRPSGVEIKPESNNNRKSDEQRESCGHFRLPPWLQASTRCRRSWWRSPTGSRRRSSACPTCACGPSCGPG